MIKLLFLTYFFLILSVCLNKRHVLTVLLILELLGLLVLTPFILGNSLFFSLILLCVLAGGGALGLGALISISRVYD